MSGKWKIDVTYTPTDWFKRESGGYSWSASAYYDDKDHTCSNPTKWMDKYNAIQDAIVTINQYEVLETERLLEEGFTYTYG